MTALFADWRHGVLLVLLFCLPVLLGDVGTALITVMACLIAITAIPRLFARDFPETPVVWLLLAAFVLMAVALSASAQSVWDARFILNFAPLLIALPLAAAEANYQPQANLTHVAILSALGALLSLVVAIGQVFILEESRAGGHVINAIHFANIAVTLGFMALIGIFTSENRWRYLLLLGPVCAILSCVLSASRGPLMGAIILYVVFVAVLWFQSRRAALLSAGIGLFGAVALLVLVANFAAPQLARLSDIASVIVQTFADGQTDDRSTNIRLGLFSGGWRAFQDAIWFGHGWERIVPATYPYVEPWLQDHLDSQNFTYLHNDLLDFAAGAGITGVIAYFAMMAAPVVGVVAGPKDGVFLGRLYGALVLSVGFFVFGLTSRLMGQGLQLTLFCMMTMVIARYGWKEDVASHAI
jgi:O-antigen ligase